MIFFHEKYQTFDEIFHYNNACDQKLLLLTFYEKPYLTAAIFELVSNERVLGEIGPDRLMPCVDPPGPP